MGLDGLRQLIGAIITAIAPRIKKVVPCVLYTLGGEFAMLGVLVLVKLSNAILGGIVEQTGNSCIVLALKSKINTLTHTEQLLAEPCDRLGMPNQTALALAHSRVELAGRTRADSPEIVRCTFIEVIAHE